MSTRNGRNLASSGKEGDSERLSRMGAPVNAALIERNSRVSELFQFFIKLSIENCDFSTTGEYETDA